MITSSRLGRFPRYNTSNNTTSSSSTKSNISTSRKKRYSSYYYLPLVASSLAAASSAPLLSSSSSVSRAVFPLASSSSSSSSPTAAWVKPKPLLLYSPNSTRRYSSMSTVSTASLPMLGIVPKEETNALAFVKANPTYDGRGVTIGIMDTGIDPGAIGLQQTSTGEMKLVDTIDCSGSGDVLLSETVTATWVAESNTTTSSSSSSSSSSYWQVQGLTGRTLKLNPSWKIHPFPNHANTTTTTSPDTTITNTSTPTAQVRLGVKSAYELFPKKLVSRVKQYRKLQLDEKQRHHAYLVRKELNELLLTNNNTNRKIGLTLEQAKKKEDLEARLELLEPSSSHEGNIANDNPQPYNDPGPIYDCVVFYDGQHYRAAIDVREDGDLTSAEALADYHKFHQVAQFSTLDMYNYAVNIYDDATVLSIVCDASPHGSHVAGIASAYQPPPSSPNNNNRLQDNYYDDTNTIIHNGVAPGAKLVSLKIGDTRLGSMETGVSLVRGLMEAIRLKCDIINLSYGEASALPNSGRFHQLATEAVQRYGIVFVTSAGNNGPALTTTGAPGGTCPSTLSIGAYVSPTMMEAGYSMHNPRWVSSTLFGDVADTFKAIATPPISEGDESKQSNAVITDEQQVGDISGVDIGSSSVIQDALTGSTYTWSSVGPASDGAQGVDVCAPGGAITCVPNWTLQKKQLMNGTSMSSPHAAGCVALLLSACKKHGISCNPNRIRRALQHTAKKMDSLSNLQQGHGMIQVDKAWEYLLNHKDDPYEDINFETYIDSQLGKPRGIYLRQPEEVAAKQVFSINVNPKFGNADDVDLETQKRRVEFEMNVALETSAPEWIKIPELLVLMYNGRSFKIEVDPTKLPPGLHTAHINGYDVSSKGGGAIFSVPVTVLIPLEQSNNINLGKLTFKAAEVKRFFLDVPAGATWMDVSVRDARCQSEDKDASPRLVVLHCLQLLPHTPYRDNEKERMLNLLPGQTSVTSVPVHGGVLCELAIARYWSAIGSTMLEVDVDFRGVSPVKRQLQMFAGGGGVSVRVESALKDETVSPSANLSKWLTPLRPKTAGDICALGERDVWPTGKKKIYQLLLTYEFDQSEAGGFFPRVPSLQEYLYESAYESQLVMIYDSNKKLIGVTDAFRQDEVKAPKGKVTLRLQVRHDQPDMLSKLKDQVIWIERKMSKEISLSTYASHEAMVTRAKTFTKCTLRKGTSLMAFIGEPTSDKLPKGAKCGDVLIGNVHYESSDGNLPGSGKRPGGYSIRYVLGPPSEAKEDVKTKDPEAPDERSEFEKLDDSILKFKVDYLKKLSEDDKEDNKFLKIFDELVKDHPDHIPLLMVHLNHHDQERWRSKRLNLIVDACDDIISKISQSDLVSYYGITGYFDKEDGKACKERKAMDEKKDALIESLARKARAVADLEKESNDMEVKGVDSSDFDRTLTELMKWVNIDSNSKYAVLSLEKERRMGRPGLVLKLINKLLEKDGEDTKGGICPMSKAELLDRRTEVLESLGYVHLSENDKLWRVLSSPKNFAPF